MEQLPFTHKLSNERNNESDLIYTMNSSLLQMIPYFFVYPVSSVCNSINERFHLSLVPHKMRTNQRWLRPPTTVAQPSSRSPAGRLRPPGAEAQDSSGSLQPVTPRSPDSVIDAENTPFGSPTSSQVDSEADSTTSKSKKSRRSKKKKPLLSTFSCLSMAVL
jgi:hypothetical protein